MGKKMQIRPFQLERYFAEYEFNAPFILSASDCESLSLQELLALGDAEGLELWRQLALGYTESQGHPLLREEVARLYQHVTPDGVLILAPEEGIFIAMHTLLQAGDHVIITFPGYQSLYEIAQALGCQVTRWTLQASENGWELDLDFLASAITPQTRLLVVNFPHNPTGYLPVRGDLEALLRLAYQHDLYLFSDEMYWLLEYEPAQRLPPVCDLYERGVSLFGLSKTFSLPGLRIGWLATQDKALLRKFTAFKDYTTICSSAPSEVLAIIALRARESIVTRNRQIIQDNLKIADQFFAQHEDWFTWLKPRAGSVAFPRLTTGMPVERLCGQALKEGVLIVPGTMFAFPGEHFRLGLGRKNLPQAMERVRQSVIQGDTG
jgi:aspartate/methionine/tyrosine aminotransferase